MPSQHRVAVVLGGLRSAFVQAVYADQNRSLHVQKALDSCLELLDGQKIGLNVGAGRTNLHPAMLNYDIVKNESIHCVGRAEALPFADNTFSVVVTQETLEHVRDPFAAMQEIHRTLRPGGILYCQVPFVIGYHPGPTDYWRFTREGIRELVEHAGLTCVEIGVTVGPATGFYRIAVEFGATVASRVNMNAYIPVKGALSLILYPIKLLDRLLIASRQCDRVAGGYFAIARKLPSGNERAQGSSGLQHE